MHRPELADLLEAAELTFFGRTLWIQPFTLESKSPVLEIALNLRHCAQDYRLTAFAQIERELFRQGPAYFL